MTVGELSAELQSYDLGAEVLLEVGSIRWPLMKTAWRETGGGFVVLSSEAAE